MHKFTLEILFQIIGIGSASGLVYQNNLLYIISDNSTFLYEYNIQKATINKIPLTENASENIPKKDKPDFEAITKKGNKLYILGSGSTEKRNSLVSYDLKTKKIEHRGIAPVYKKIKDYSGISNEDLNIEGLIIASQDILFFQRGNGKNAKNGIFIAEDTSETETMKIKFQPISLPKIKNVEATFTDAVAVGNKIYFLAAAEDTDSTYNDGEVLGSFVGSIDAEKMTIDFTQQITDTHKFEGLTLYQETEKEISFLLCEDNDTEELKANVFKLTIKK